MTSDTHLIDFDAALYRARYPDLAHLDDLGLRRHFDSHGERQGRVGHRLATRQGFLESIPADAEVLEIGPFQSPSLTGANVRYFDVLDREALRLRAIELSVPPERVPHIDFVNPEGDLSGIAAKFDILFSSHAIEHQPDLVYHLQQVARLLKPGGCYMMAVPDKHYCFDHFIAESSIADVVAAHAEGRRRHTLRNLIDSRALTTHNDCTRHWAGDHGTIDMAESARLIGLAQAEFSHSGGSYIDVHAWRFTPRGFSLIHRYLRQLGLSPFLAERVFSTCVNTSEFMVILASESTAPA
jgi:SAM-dependent methyltransferase